MALNDHIAQALETEILAGRTLPGPLTLDGLAEAYGVSTFPVRRALLSLVRKGLVKKESNGRLAVNPEKFGKGGPGARHLKVKPPKDYYQIIANDLTRLSLKGKNVVLREAALSARYNIGRTLLRGVFAKLAGTGLLEHLPRKGWRLRGFSRADLESFLEVRELLELKALDLSRDHLERSRLEEFLAGNRPGSATDNRFHAYLIECSGNRYIQDFFSRHTPYFNLLFEWEGKADQESTRRTCLQHRKILEALLQKDWVKAKEALSHHIRYNHPIFLGSLP